MADPVSPLGGKPPGMGNSSPEPSTPPRDALVEIGVSGLRQTYGYIDEEFLKSLRGRKAVEVYDEMGNNSPILGGIELAIDQLIRRTALFVKPFDDSAVHVERAEFVMQCLNDMGSSLPEVFSEILTMIRHGWAYMEQVYKVRDGVASKFDDGRIGWRKWSIRSQDSLERWQFADHAGGDGSLTGMWQRDPNGTRPPVMIPLEKALLFRPKAHKGNPEGKSCFRAAYVPYFYSKRVLEILGIGIERDLAGLPVIWCPPEILSDKATADLKLIKASLEKTVQNLKRGHQEGLLMPLAFDDKGNKTYDVSLLGVQGGGGRQFDIPKILELINRMMAMALLADWLLLGHESVGSFALSSDKTKLFSTALAGWLESILEVINRYAIPRLWRLNGWPVSECPTLEHGDVETMDLNALSNFLKALTGMGVVLDDDLENFLRKQAGLPEMAERKPGEERPAPGQQTGEPELPEDEDEDEENEGGPPKPAAEAA